MVRRGRPVFVCGLVVIAVVLAAGPAAAQGAAARWAAQRGLDMPRPFGIGVTLYNQTQDYTIVTLQATLAGLDLGQLPDLEVTNRTETPHLKLDYWVLPYLNVFALIGEVDGKTTVDLSGVDLGFPLPITGLTVDYSGTFYGGGATLAGGGEHLFATLTYDYTETDLDVSTSSVKAWVLTPKLGVHWGTAGAIWVGAMYQDAQEIHQGVFDIPYLGAVPYYVELKEKDPWNGVLGGSAELGEHWVLIMEGGFGNRDTALATLEYRF